jgi:DNA-binding NarL/FixJ family response regulator
MTVSLSSAYRTTAKPAVSTTAPAFTGVPLGAIPHPRSTTFSVLVVDDQPLQREALVAQLQAMGAGPVHEAATVAEARARAHAGGPCDLALLHLSHRPGDGLDLIAELRSKGWAKLVVLGAAQDPSLVRAVFHAGAQAYLLSTSAVATLTDGMDRVLSGGLYADPHIAPLLAAPSGSGRDERAANQLSAREIQVLELVADGQSNKEIGEKLTLSALTIKSHLSRIGRKLKTGDRAEMIALAMRAGTIQ